VSRPLTDTPNLVCRTRSGHPNKCRTGYLAHELGHQPVPTRPVSGDSEMSERTGNPRNPKIGPDIPPVKKSTPRLKGGPEPLEKEIYATLAAFTATCAPQHTRNPHADCSMSRGHGIVTLLPLCLKTGIWPKPLTKRSHTSNILPR